MVFPNACPSTDQTDSELAINATDFQHQIGQSCNEMPALHVNDAPESQLELSFHCEDTNYGESLRGSLSATDSPLLSSCSGDVAAVSNLAGEVVLPEEVPTSVAVDFKTIITATDTVGSAMAETGDAGGIAAEESGTMVVEAVNSVPVKRKRGRPRKNPEAKASLPVRKKERENVCFVCFDRTNPNLVACNRRGCYKAYHPACVNRDDAFFGSKAKWSCGWHMCSTCQRAAHYMCYTCTTSYCKECIIGENKYVCVRGTYGFCQSCHNTVTLIELNKLAFQKKDGSDFDDTDSFTYLFKAYWLDQKEKLSLTPEELNNARHPYSLAPGEDSSDDLYDVNEDQGSSSESSSDHKSNFLLKKKVRSRSQADKNLPKEVDGGGTVLPQETGWASRELLELVAHMRNGDQSAISQFDVQAILLDYIKKYNLRDPRRKSQIICDLRLRNLFGKERVGHFEMLKLLESHFLSKEVLQVVDGNQAETLDPDNKIMDDIEESDAFARVVSEKRRKNRKRTEELELQMNADDYAAIDVHNITHIFLRRSLLEDLLDDVETFKDKVVGSFVRIRISNAGQRQDLYRLVQIVGTQEGSKLYKVGKRTTNIVLEILNLNKKETSTIDSISNQDFTEEECQRLRQSIKCGLIDRLKVGYIQEKAKTLHAVRVNDSFETEKLRLSHLRDRASETGRRKELRECVEKLQLLNNPEERRRRLNEVPKIHADPKMDPEYESSEEVEDDKLNDYQITLKEASSLRKRRELIPRGRSGTQGNNWNGMNKFPQFNRELKTKMQGEFWHDRSDTLNNIGERPNEFPQNQSKETFQTEASFTPALQTPRQGNYAPKSLELQPHGSAPEFNSTTPEGSLPSIPNEVEKIWHYRDPSMNIQGPFSLSQLRKWNTTGYFPPDLKIWTTSEQEDSKLLSDVLAGRLYKDSQQQVPRHGNFPNQATLADRQQNRGNWNTLQNTNTPSLDGLPSPPPVWSFAGAEVSNSYDGKPTLSNIPSPAGPIYNNPYHIPVYQVAGRDGESDGGLNQERAYETVWSPTRPMDGISGNTLKVKDDGKSDPFVVSAGSSAYELNACSNRFRSYESDCPSPTPRIERKDSFLRHDEFGSVSNATVNHGRPCETLDSSLTSLPAHSASVNFESSNTALAASLTDKVPGNGGLQNAASIKPVSSEFQNKLSPIAATIDNIGSLSHTQTSNLSPMQKIETGFQAMDYASVQKRLSLTSSFHGMEHDRSQNPNGNFSPIHQMSTQNASELECSLPSPTPKSSKNSWGIDTANASSNASSQNQKQQTVQNTNAGWCTPAYANSNSSTGWGTSIHGISNANAGLGIQIQGNVNENANANANANTCWMMPVEINANTNTGLGGAMPQENGWNSCPATTGWVNVNPGATREAIPKVEDDPVVRAGWGSPYGSINGCWKSSDGDASRRFDYEGHNGDGYTRHRDREMGRHGASDPRNNWLQLGSRGGSSRPHQAFPGGDGPRGVCKFYENGHCKKGRSCKYLHTDMRRGI